MRHKVELLIQLAPQIARTVPDPFLRRGWVSGDETTLFSTSLKHHPIGGGFALLISALLYLADYLADFLAV